MKKLYQAAVLLIIFLIMVIPALCGDIQVIPVGTTYITTTLTVQANDTLKGSGFDCIIDISNLPYGATAIIMEDGARLEGFKIVGSPSIGYANKILAGNNCSIERIWISQNSYGIQCLNKHDIYIRDVRFDNIHDVNGWGACIEATGTSNLYVDGIKAINCDRGLEVEGGSKTVYMRNGVLENIRVPGHYSYVLDAHTHINDLNPVEDVHYENFTLIGTAGITACGADEVPVKNISFKNIAMINPIPFAYAIIDIYKADRVTVDGFTGTGITSENVFGTGGEKIILNNLDIEATVSPRVINGPGSNVILSNSKIKTTGTGYALRIYSPWERSILDNVELLDSTGLGRLLIGYQGTPPIISNCWIRE